MTASVMELTDNQLLASTTLDRPVAVTAGPGSGKTRVLVSRYIGILESGKIDSGSAKSKAVEIENIVAITFTNKAAAEIRERIRQALDRKIHEAADPKTRMFWRGHRRKLESAVVTTIHGFCSRLLREHPVEAGVDPAFRTLEGYDETQMTEAAAHAAVTAAIDSGSSAVAELVASYSRSKLVEAIGNVHKKIRSLGLTLDDVVATTEQRLASREDLLGIAAEIDVVIAEALSTIAALPSRTSSQRSTRNRVERKFEAFAAAWAPVRKFVEDAPLDSIDGQLFGMLRAAAGAAPGLRISTTVRPYAEDLRRLLGSWDERGEIQLVALDLVAKAYLPEFAQLVHAMGDLYEFEKAERSSLDFEDLQLSAQRLLSEHEAIAVRARERYRYFLVDEFQDTNGLQRRIVDQFLKGPNPANLFIVGDPKQSIYGFRGAEVSVFAETSREIGAAGGERVSLDTNFRSDGRLVGFVQDLFDAIMRKPEKDLDEDLESVGFVENEHSTADHVPGNDDICAAPVIELVLATDWPGEVGTESKSEAEGDSVESPAFGEESNADLEARLLAERIRELVQTGDAFIRTKARPPEPQHRACRYGDVAILLRARTNVKRYERALRRAGVPFYVVAGKGFYDRPETRDLLELLRFLDNATDDLALATVLRSPLFGISDETLLALRADRLAAMQVSGRRPRASGDRTLWQAVVEHRRMELVAGVQRAPLERAVEVLSGLRASRNRIPISALLRRAIRATDIDVVLASAEDGAQRLSNVEKLVAVARTFERGSGRLLGDFTEYVREFNRLEADESEASARSDSNAVAIMTAHSSKGLEFRVVAIPNLDGSFRNRGDDVLVDRLMGIGFRVPDGTAQRQPTRLHDRMAQRQKLRERFESMRLFFVAATRAEDRLILSASPRSIKLDETGVPEVNSSREAVEESSWYAWLLRAISENQGRFDLEADEVVFGESRIRLIRRPRASGHARTHQTVHDSGGEDRADASRASSIDEEAVSGRVERLLRPVAPAAIPALTRFAVTSLLGFETCRRRFLLGRILKMPDLSAFEASRDESERPEPGSKIDSSLRGLLVHRFCETLAPGESVEGRLLESVADVRRDRGEVYADVLARFDDVSIAGEVRRLAENYAGSRLRSRIDELVRVRPEALVESALSGSGGYVVSEMGFSLRFDDGSVVGSVDKTLLVEDGAGGWIAEVIDFKTNWIAGGEGRMAGLAKLEQSYRLQMQAYALAVRRLVPRVSRVSASLVALAAGPDVAVTVDPASVEESSADEAVRTVLGRIREAGEDPVRFPATAGPHCLSCAHIAVCPEGSAAVQDTLHHSK